MKHCILVCGGRDYLDNKQVTFSLDHAQKHWFASSFCIIEGGAAGADTLARVWAMRNGVCCLTVTACWDVYKKAAGSIRNSWMLDFGMPDLVIAFPGGTGTANMVKQAKAQAVDIWQVL